MKGLRAPSLARLLDRQGIRLGWLPLSKAHALGCCIRCRADARLRDWTVLDQNEWHLSGLCPDCYAAIMPEEDDCE